MMGIWHVKRMGAAGFLVAGMVVLLFAAEVVAASPSPNPAPPVFASSVDAAPVAGKVLYTTPGGSQTSLTSARQVPVGTAFDVLHGTVRITAADGQGGTFTGTFGKGKFEILQSDSGGGAAEIKLLGKACARSGSARTSSVAAGRIRASTARSTKHRPPVFRQLQVNAGGNFLVVGVDATAVASGQATYSLVDACDGTQIVDKSGRVVAQHRQAPAKKLKPGQSDTDYCHPASSPTFCQFMIQSPRNSVFSFGLSLTQPRASSFRVCYRTPSGKKKCFTAPLSQGSIQGGSLTCIVNDGPGTYPVHYSVAGQQIGITLRFKATQPRHVFLGRDACRSMSG